MYRKFRKERLMSNIPPTSEDESVAEFGERLIRECARIASNDADNRDGNVDELYGQCEASRRIYKTILVRFGLSEGDQGGGS